MFRNSLAQRGLYSVVISDPDEGLLESNERRAELELVTNELPDQEWSHWH